MCSLLYAIGRRVSVYIPKTSKVLTMTDYDNYDRVDNTGLTLSQSADFESDKSSRDPDKTRLCNVKYIPSNTGGLFY